jgi:hypothetical protein
MFRQRYGEAVRTLVENRSTEGHLPEYLALENVVQAMNSMDVSEPTMLISPSQHRALLEQISAQDMFLDRNSDLRDGTVGRFMGVNFVESRHLEPGVTYQLMGAGGGGIGGVPQPTDTQLRIDWERWEKENEHMQDEEDHQRRMRELSREE